MASSSVFEYTLSRSSAVKDTPQMHHPKKTMADSVNNDEYMILKRLTVDSQLLKLSKPEVCHMCGVQPSKLVQKEFLCVKCIDMNENPGQVH